MRKKTKAEFSAQYLDPRWQKTRLEVFKRDCFTCQNCGSTEKPLHAHHTFYWPDCEGPWDYDNSSILTLCNDCREEEHENLPTRKATIFHNMALAGFRTSSEIDAFCDLMMMICEATYSKSAREFIDVILDTHIRSLKNKGSS